MVHNATVSARRDRRWSKARLGSRQRGFSLVEVLVAALVLSIGMLGLAALQARGLQANDSARMRTQASIAAYDLVDRLRANPASFFDKGQASKGVRTIGANDCDSLTNATGAVGRWRKDFCAIKLPKPASGDLASVDCQDSNPCGAGNCAVVFRWGDARGEAPPASGSGRNPGVTEFLFCTRLATAI